MLSRPARLLSYETLSVSFTGLCPYLLRDSVRIFHETLSVSLHGPALDLGSAPVMAAPGLHPSWWRRVCTRGGGAERGGGGGGDDNDTDVASAPRPAPVAEVVLDLGEMMMMMMTMMMIMIIVLT